MGNRSDTGITTDMLNRATASQDGARSSDILGNTTMITYSGNLQRTFDWDCLNRLLDKKASGVVQASYNYRADGLRVGKYVASGNKTTVYRYDGQMGMEDVETSPGTSTVTDYAIGARGVDGISTAVNGAASTVAYPIYDAHGNMIATLAKGGSNTYSVGNQRSYDAWGGIRIGNLTGDPKQQYCANLGHRADDETGFIYMRARYYEPSTARFLSEDLSHEGCNWYRYASNNPVSLADASGADGIPVPGWVGPSATTLWWLGLVSSLVGLAKSSIALQKFISNIQLAADSLDVENYFGEFMKGFNKSGFGLLDSGGNLGSIVTLARSALSMLNGIGRSSSMASVAQTLIGGVLLGAQFAILGFAYQMRIAWYVDDIG